MSTDLAPVGLPKPAELQTAWNIASKIASCACGCGKETTVYRGKPRKYRQGHAARTKPLPPEVADAIREAQQSGEGHVRPLGTLSTSTRERLGSAKTRRRIVWSRCPSCGREAWVSLKAFGHLCTPCHCRLVAQPTRSQKGYERRPEQSERQRGAGNPMWRGGRRRADKGYIHVLMSLDDPLYEMAHKGGTVLEHRLVVARALGRPLKRTETVHHRNGVKHDNRLENLELWFGNHGTGHRASDHHCPGCRCFDEEGW